MGAEKALKRTLWSEVWVSGGKVLGQLKELTFILQPRLLQSRSVKQIRKSAYKPGL